MQWPNLRWPRVGAIEEAGSSDRYAISMVSPIYIFYGASSRDGIVWSPGRGNCLETSKVRYQEKGIIASFSNLSTYALVVSES